MNRLFKMSLAVGCAALLVAGPAIAAEQGLSSLVNSESKQKTVEETKASRLDEIVVTATKYETSIKNVPASISIITHEDLAAQHLPNGDIADALRSIPGVAVRRAAGPFPAYINIRGTSSDETLILVNGVPTEWEITQAIVPENVERIEVMRGPASALYGANASGGVINIITKNGGNESNSVVGGSVGSFNSWRLNASSNGSVGGFHYSMSAYREGSDGTNVVRNNVNAGTHMIDDCPYDKWAASLNTSYDLPEDGRLSLLYNFHHDEYTRGRPNVRGDWDRHFTALTLEQPINDKYSFKGYVGYRYDDLLHTYDNGGTNYSLKQKRYTTYTELPAELQLTTQALAGHVITTGYFFNNQRSEMRFKKPNGTIIGDQNYKVLTQAGYLQDVWKPIDALTITSGVRYDHWKNYDTEYYNFNTKRPADRTEGNWSPKFGIKYNFQDSTSIWANYSVGFLPPTAEQLYDDRSSGGNPRRPNPDLKPQTTRSYEVGVERWFAERVQTKLCGFYSYTDDKISSWFDSSNVWINENIGRSKSYGFEAECLYKVNDNWSLLANYTYDRATIDKNPSNPSQEGNELTFSPRHMANVGVTYTQPEGWDLSAFARYISEQQTNDDNIRYTASGEEQFMKDSVVVDLKATKHFVVKCGPLKKIDASFSIDNLFDKNYRTFYIYEDPGTVYTFETKFYF